MSNVEITDEFGRLVEWERNGAGTFRLRVDVEDGCNTAIIRRIGDEWHGDVRAYRYGMTDGEWYELCPLRGWVNICGRDLLTVKRFCEDEAGARCEGATRVGGYAAVVVTEYMEANNGTRVSIAASGDGFIVRALDWGGGQLGVLPAVDFATYEEARAAMVNGAEFIDYGLSLGVRVEQRIVDMDGYKYGALAEEKRRFDECLARGRKE